MKSGVDRKLLSIKLQSIWEGLTKVQANRSPPHPRAPVALVLTLVERLHRYKSAHHALLDVLDEVTDLPTARELATKSMPSHDNLMSEKTMIDAAGTGKFIVQFIGEKYKIEPNYSSHRSARA